MPERVSQEDYEQLDIFLVGQEDDPFYLPPISAIDGFLTAVAICPDPIPESEWLEALLGDASDWFWSRAGASDAVGVMKRMLEDIIASMEADPPEFEALLEAATDGTPLGEIWSEGFVDAMYLREKVWERFWNHPQARDVLFPLVALGRPDLIEMLEPNRKKQERRVLAYSNAIDLHATAAYRVARYSDDELDARALAMSEEAAREEERAQERRATKVGRNDPCPCGSGKKFKKCCGAA